MAHQNKGFDPTVIQQYRDRMKANGTTWLMDEEDPPGDEYAHFYFIGTYEGKEVIYDAVMYTLRLQHESELFEIAEERASRQFPDYRRIADKEDTEGESEEPDPLEEEIGLYMAEVIMELEEEEAVKVSEHVDMDVTAGFGIALEIGLHREKITPGEIEQFIQAFHDDAITLDENLYSFQTKDEAS